MRSLRRLSALIAGAAIFTVPAVASAQLTIKQPNAHPDYKVELEPHGDFIFFRYGGAGYDNYAGRDFGSPEFGAGFRASIKLADPAFIPRLNNTVAISFGVDVTNCQYCRYNDTFRIWNPVTLQWSFWFTKQWSAFADLGFMLRNDGFYQHVYPDFMAEIGGRYLFNDKISLTMRLGYPFLSVGVSFFAG